jgi:sulfite reductase (NADPH) flavoprotein alpha-component
MSSFIPDTAPFSVEQRAWLNGFFSGLMGIRPDMNPASALVAAGISTESIEPKVEEHFPWRDSALPIVDRLQLAEGRPLELRMMAAMAQLDCGSCGYLCKTYSEAIARGEETNLGLCSPGGKETKKVLKQLAGELAAAGSKPAHERQTNGKQANGTQTNGKHTNGTPTNGKPANGHAGWSRQHPLTATLLESSPLNKAGSSKDTRHVVIDLAGSGLTYHVGDALGVYPTNCSELANMIIGSIAADAGVPVTTPQGNHKPLLSALYEDCCLKDPSDELLELVLQHVTDETAKQTLQTMLRDGVPEGVDVLDILCLCPHSTVTATELMETLEPLNPRLYSIASSMKVVGEQVHLTVGKVSYEREGRHRKGVASTMFAERLHPGQQLRVYPVANHGGFTVPADPTKPMIMVGPGTGIAPFMAFLQERAATQATGKNWLFFGDQRSETDFLYQERLSDYVTSGLLTRLDTAFSRDSAAKVYVQNRMLENAAQLWQWLQEGAYFYVCGDASRMAADVNKALIQVVAQEGKMSNDDATAYVTKMLDDKRYVRDVY